MIIDKIRFLFPKDQITSFGRSQRSVYIKNLITSKGRPLKICRTSYLKGVYVTANIVTDQKGSMSQPTLWLIQRGVTDPDRAAVGTPNVEESRCRNTQCDEKPNKLGRATAKDRRNFSNSLTIIR